ncbi:hypothetical protein C2G38_2198627 [Gigaspora rosea]|uniref:Uncharacterized protein n=1 Tax=Gigaspora rosea TaxID=44941 RepID=A0A397UU42_9GLOM|nr:hypothetical protein C2G38_2198627 [Gigaspora rosea]
MEADFNHKWEELVKKYSEKPLIIVYLQDTWLPFKAHFVRCWVDHYLHLATSKIISNQIPIDMSIVSEFWLQRRQCDDIVSRRGPCNVKNVSSSIRSRPLYCSRENIFGNRESIQRNQNYGLSGNDLNSSGSE